MALIVFGKFDEKVYDMKITQKILILIKIRILKIHKSDNAQKFIKFY